MSMFSADEVSAWLQEISDKLMGNSNDRSVQRVSKGSGRKDWRGTLGSEMKALSAPPKCPWKMMCLVEQCSFYSKPVRQEAFPLT